MVDSVEGMSGGTFGNNANQADPTDSSLDMSYPKLKSEVLSLSFRMETSSPSMPRPTPWTSTFPRRSLLQEGPTGLRHPFDLKREHFSSMPVMSRMLAVDVVSYSPLLVCIDADYLVTDW